MADPFDEPDQSIDEISHGPDKQDLVDIVLPLWFTLAQLRGQRHLAFRILQD